MSSNIQTKSYLLVTFCQNSSLTLFFFFANSTDLIFLSKSVTVIQPSAVLNDKEFIIIIQSNNIV